MVHGVIVWHSPIMGMGGRAYGGVSRVGELLVWTRSDLVPFSFIGTMRVLRARMGCAVWRVKHWLLIRAGFAVATADAPAAYKEAKP